MVDLPSSIEMDVPAGEVEASVARVCAEWGVELTALDVEMEEAAEPGVVHLHITRRASAASDDPTLEQARQTLAELLGQMKVRAAVEANWGPEEETGGARPIILDVRGEDLGMLIGRKGETLAALQYITRLILAKQAGDVADVVVDVQGHKRRREEQLRRMARRMAEQAVQRQRVMTLEPMSAYERRIIHLELRNHPQVRTESIGEGHHRKVTIIPQ